jgi:Mg2+ and Co2+ transporter CorA
MHERVIAGDPDGHGFRWTDVEAPTPDDMRALYARVGLPAHLPADEPRMPRPSVFEEDGFAFVTLVGASGDGLVAVRCFVGPDWLLTTHARPVDGLDEMAHASAERLAGVGVEVETLREALHDATSDHQNEVVKRLTVIAAIFLPLTFITGFFGQNFGWLVAEIDGAGAFLLLGVVLPVVAVVLLFGLLARSGWL